MRQRLITIFVILLLLGLTMWAMPHRNEGKEANKVPVIPTIRIIEKAVDFGSANPYVYRYCIDGYEYVIAGQTIVQSYEKIALNDRPQPKTCGGNQ